MKEIELTNRILKVPEHWEDLNNKQLLYTIYQLQCFMAGYISLSDLRAILFIYFTGYKHKNLKTVEERENVMHNLIILSEIIQFPVRKNKEGKVVANNIFNKNPIPFIRIGLKKHVGAKFTSGIITDTDITASQYANSFDIALGFAQTKKQELLDALVLELYPTIKSHINKVPMEIKWIIWFWFTGVIDYFANHPIYSVLYPANKEVSEDKIRLGMTEAIMSLTSSGFGSLQELKSISVIEFFDIQVKDLKTKISAAVAKGAKYEDIADTTGLSHSQISTLC